MMMQNFESYFGASLGISAAVLILLVGMVIIGGIYEKVMKKKK